MCLNVYSNCNLGIGSLMFKEQISIIYVLYVIFTHPYNTSWSALDTGAAFNENHYSLEENESKIYLLN